MVTTEADSLLPLPSATFHILVALADEDLHGYAVIKDVAARTGYNSPWQLSQQLRELTGRTAEEIRRDMTQEDLVALLADQVRRRRRKEE